MTDWNQDEKSSCGFNTFNSRSSFPDYAGLKVKVAMK